MRGCVDGGIGCPGCGVSPLDAAALGGEGTQGPCATGVRFAPIAVVQSAASFPQTGHANGCPDGAAVGQGSHATAASSNNEQKLRLARGDK